MKHISFDQPMNLSTTRYPEYEDLFVE